MLRLLRFALAGLLLAMLAGRASADTAAPACIFCEIVAGTRPAAIVYRDELVVAFLDHAPRNPGHVLVVPAVHAVDLTSTPPATAAQMVVVAQRIAGAIQRTDLKAEGFNFLANAGAPAGQKVFHTHLHIMPRFAGDAGMGAERAIVGPEVLDSVAAKIRAALATEPGEASAR